MCLPYIAVLTDPTMGSGSASVAMLGDVVIAEPRARISLAGPRVIAQTLGQLVPEESQRAEFLLAHGQLDLIVERRALKHTLGRLLAFFMDQPMPIGNSVHVGASTSRGQQRMGCANSGNSDFSVSGDSGRSSRGSEPGS